MKEQIPKETILKLFPWAFDKVDLRIYTYNPAKKTIKYIGKA